MIILRIPGSLTVLMAGLLMAACNNDLDVTAPYRCVPVVYCIISPNDSLQCLRLEKSFLGDTDALEMARHTDTIYYPEAQVVIERWANGEKKEQFQLERRELAARKDGIFSNDPNLLYVLDRPVQTAAEYRLRIGIPGVDSAITATTHTIGDFKIVRPEAFRRSLPFSSYDNYLKVEWITAPYTRLYHLMLRFHYLEVYYSDTVHLSADWNIGNFIASAGTGGEVMDVEILQRNFYKWVGNKLHKPPDEVHRLADKKAIDFVFTVGGDELYTYIEVYKEDAGLPKEKPVFTNITNGIGLFASRFEQMLAGKALSEHSIDSLAYGIYTKHLRFADSQDDYYYTSGF